MTRVRGKDLALVVPGQAEYLWLVRMLVNAVAHKVGFPAHRVGEIEIAVDEACANIIEHGYQQRTSQEREQNPPGAIVVRLVLFPDRLEVRIRDRGPCFTPPSAPHLDLAEFLASGRQRGIGIAIIHRLMDEVRHTYRPQRGNELTLVKYLPEEIGDGAKAEHAEHTIPGIAG